MVVDVDVDGFVCVRVRVGLMVGVERLAHP
jgi:hypothetical protein